MNTARRVIRYRLTQETSVRNEFVMWRQVSTGARAKGERPVPPYTCGSVLLAHDVVSIIHQSLPAPAAVAVATTVQRVVKHMLMTALVSTMPRFRGVHSSTFQLNVSIF